MKNTYSEKDKKFLKKLGENLRKSRLLKDISQEELAFLSNLDRTYISGIERGERNISIITLKKLLDSLKINISDIIGNEK